MRLVALADEGPVLFDVACDGAGVVYTQTVEGMATAAEIAANVAWQAWGPQAAQVGFWKDDVWLTQDGGAERTYGGDPLLLRTVRGAGPDMEVGDYRRWQSGLLAYQAVAAGAGYTVRIELMDPRLPIVQE
jgi:hypothetical protein